MSNEISIQVNLPTEQYVKNFKQQYTALIFNDVVNAAEKGKLFNQLRIDTNGAEDWVEFVCAWTGLKRATVYRYVQFYERWLNADETLRETYNKLGYSQVMQLRDEEIIGEDADKYSGLSVSEVKETVRTERHISKVDKDIETLNAKKNQLEKEVEYYKKEFTASQGLRDELNEAQAKYSEAKARLEVLEKEKSSLVNKTRELRNAYMASIRQVEFHVDGAVDVIKKLVASGEKLSDLHKESKKYIEILYTKIDMLIELMSPEDTENEQ